jgi:hypothetical protein
MVRGLATLFLGLLPCFVADAISAGFRDSDFLEVKASEKAEVQDEAEANEDRYLGRKERRQERASREEESNPIRMKDGGVFDVGKVTNYKVLRDDQVVELRNPRSGRLEITIIKAAALPEEDLNRYDLQYTVMELDELTVSVDKHEEKERTVKVDWNGNIRYPLIGEVYVKGLTTEQIKQKFADLFRSYVKDPEVSVTVSSKSPLSRILVIGSGFREFQGHEKILDILGADYQTTWENVYDRFCVIRKKSDGSFMCIVVDLESMFKRFDFRENIPIRAGDIILVKKMPPLFGNRFKFWWQQTLSWLGEVDELLNSIKSIVDWRLKD